LKVAKEGRKKREEQLNKSWYVCARKRGLVKRLTRIRVRVRNQERERESE
jgi:hypothetical protein